MHVTLREAELASPPMTHGLYTRVDQLIRDHRRATGLTLTPADALAELDRIDGGKPTPRAVRPLPVEPVAEPFPFRADIALAESKLIDLGYDDETTALIIADIRRSGTAWCSTHFHDAAEIEHTEIIEAVLDSASAWQWGPEYGDVTGDDRFAGSAGYAGLAVRGKRAGDGVFRD